MHVVPHTDVNALIVGKAASQVGHQFSHSVVIKVGIGIRSSEPQSVVDSLGSQRTAVGNSDYFAHLRLAALGSDVSRPTSHELCRCFREPIR